MEIGEVAASAAGDQDFLSELSGTLQDGHAATALSRLDGAHESGGSGAENEDVKRQV
jgi:hypothetical protein